VLVVEDEAIIALMIEAELLNEGAVVIRPASTVQQALALLKHHMPDVATLDLNLNGVPSTEVANTLDALHVPFLLASAYSNRSRVQLPSAAGVIESLTARKASSPQWSPFSQSDRLDPQRLRRQRLANVMAA
jgi:CheY-like chemotaxis protein